jgi:hypothetical protein
MKITKKSQNKQLNTEKAEATWWRLSSFCFSWAAQCRWQNATQDEVSRANAHSEIKMNQRHEWLTWTRTDQVYCSWSSSLKPNATEGSLLQGGFFLWFSTRHNTKNMKCLQRSKKLHLPNKVLVLSQNQYCLASQRKLAFFYFPHLARRESQ